MTSTRYVFFDGESSSLTAHRRPIEIAIIDEGGIEHDWMIAIPADCADWDPASQEIHGITRAELISGGRPGWVVAREFLAALDGAAIVSDGPEFDAGLIETLLSDADLPPIRVRHIDDVITSEITRLATALPPGSLTKPLCLSILRDAKEEAGRLAPIRHRALADARHIRAQYLAVKHRVDTLVASA